jgi:hypothetical protein
MKIVFNGLPRTSLNEFAEANDLTLVVREREPEFWSRGRYFAEFDGSEIKNDGCLATMSGNGETISLAIHDYARRLGGKTLVFNAYRSTRREIISPYFF